MYRESVATITVLWLPAISTNAINSSADTSYENVATSVQMFVNMFQNWVFSIFSFLWKHVNKKILKLSVLQTGKITMKTLIKPT